MKIALVLDDTLDRPDGVQQFVLLTGKWLRERGHEISYLVAETQRQDVPGIVSLGQLAGANFNGNRVRTPLPASRGRIRAELARLRPDVVHVQLPCSPLLGAQVVQSAAPRTAVVGTFHILPSAWWHTSANRLLAQALGPALRRLDAVMAVSAPAAEFARRVYTLPTAKVVPNPVEVARFATGRVRVPRADIVTVAFLGRLVQRKGVLQLIRAFLALPPPAAGAARLVIGGSGPLEGRARKLAGDDPRISFNGFVVEADKPDFLAAGDIAVFPSTGGESFGISLIEAMAAGAGVVLGGNNPGYASVLGGQPDSLVEPDNTAAFAAVLARFINDKSLRERLGREQAVLVKRYDINVVGPEIEAVYQRALEQRHE